MRKTALPAALGAAALVLGASASAAPKSFSPHLNVSTPQPGGTSIGFNEAVADAAPAKVTIYVDKGLTGHLSPAAGATIGTTAAKASAAALGGAVLPLTGTIQVRAADGTYGSNGAQVPLATASMACTGTATHTVFWVLALTAAGQSLEVPVFVDDITATDPAAAFASASITICLPSPSVPPPQGAAFGAKLISATLRLPGIFSGPAGEYRFRAVVTPYVAGSATPDTAGTVEIQGLDRAPSGISILARRSAKGKALITGRVYEAGFPGKGVPNVPVVIRGGKRVVSVKTGPAGGYRATVLTRSLVAKLTATTVVPLRDLGASACQATFSAQSIPCADAAIGGFTATSPAVKPR